MITNLDDYFETELTQQEKGFLYSSSEGAGLPSKTRLSSPILKAEKIKPVPRPVVVKKSFLKGQHILVQDENTLCLYILSRGRVEIIKDGVFVTVVSQRGAILGEISSLLGIRNSATVRAVEDCLVYEVSDFETLTRNNPKAMIEVAKLLARRLLEVNSFLVDLKKDFEKLQQENDGKAGLDNISRLQSMLYDSKLDDVSD